MNNYPPGVSAAHPYFNPPTCQTCREVLDENDRCPECGWTPPDPDDYDEVAADDERHRRSRR